MRRSIHSTKLRISASKGAIIFGLVLGLLCLSRFVYAYDSTSVAQKANHHAFAAEMHYAPLVKTAIPTLPTVPSTQTPTVTPMVTVIPTATLTTLPTATPTAPPTATPTASPTATPTVVAVTLKGNTEVVATNKEINYKITANNPTANRIGQAILYFTIPPYTTFDLTKSQAGWQCPSGVTAGQVCQFALGDLPADATANVNFALDVLQDQLPTDPTQIDITVFLGDSSGKIYSSALLSGQVSKGPTAEEPAAEPVRRQLFLPILYQP